MYEPGDRVRVLSSEKPGHVRTPAYLKGKTGWVESLIGAFPNPEEIAYGLSGRLWDDYRGPAEDRLYADIYEHWLEPERGTM